MAQALHKRVQMEQEESKDWHRMQFLIRPSHFDELKSVASYEDRSVGSLIRQVLAEFLRDREEADREKNLRDRRRRK